MTTATFNITRHGASAERHSTSFASFIRLAIAARHQRIALKKLDDSALNDIGLTRADVASEATRSAWDVPTNWLR